MGIMADDIATLEHVINEKLKQENMSFKMSVHFVRDRMNDTRNNPLITITELQNWCISSDSAVKKNDTANKHFS